MILNYINKYLYIFEKENTAKNCFVVIREVIKKKWSDYITILPRHKKVLNIILYEFYVQIPFNGIFLVD